MLDLHPRPSVTLSLLLALAHLLSLGAIWSIVFDVVLGLGSSLILAGSFMFYLRRDGLLAAPKSIIHIRFDHNGKCAYQTRDGTGFEATLLGSTLSTPWLSVLNLKPDGRWLARHVVIFPDSADAETLRKLRVLLRWKHPDSNRR